MEVYYSTAFNAAILQKNGAITSINSDSAELIRHLYHEAAKTQRYGGLTDEEALAMITINPAKQLGIRSRERSHRIGADVETIARTGMPGGVHPFQTGHLDIFKTPQSGGNDAARHSGARNQYAHGN
jgi:hypothetical protein